MMRSQCTHDYPEDRRAASAALIYKAGKNNIPECVTASCTHTPAEPSLSTYTKTCTDTERIVPASPPSAQTTSLARSRRCSWAQRDTSWCPPSCQGAPTHFCRGQKKERTNPGWRDVVALVTNKGAFCLSILMFSYAWILLKATHCNQTETVNNGRKKRYFNNFLCNSFESVCIIAI